MATIEETLGTDLAHISDLKKSATGDLDKLSGLANVEAALFHRLITEPGTLIHRPNYGVGIKQYQNGPNTLSSQRQLALRIQEQFIQDDRVEAVLGVSVKSEDTSPHKVILTVRVKIVGYGEAALQFTPFGEGI
jgi:hypothetical protein